MAAREIPTAPAGGMICVGVVTGARGLKGEVRIKSFTGEPGEITAYGPLWDETGARSFQVHVTGSAKGQLLARIEGIGDRTAAEALKGTHLYVPRQALPETEEEEYYHADLVGLRVERIGGGDLGVVRAVHDFGAGPILEVEPKGSGNSGFLVPFRGDIVPQVLIAEGRLVIDPPLGLLEDPDGSGEEPGGESAGGEN